MKEADGFKEYFVKDLMRRGELTLTKAAANDFENLSKFTLKTLRKAMEGSPMLDPLNLLFFVDKILELHFIDDQRLAETIKALFDLSLSYALVFKKEKDYYTCLDLLRLTKNTIAAFEANIELFVTKESIMTDLFSNKLLQALTITMNVEKSESLNDRQRIIIEMIVRIVKLKQRFEDVSGKEIRLGFELSESMSKALKLFETIEEGKEFKTFIASRKFEEILFSRDAKKIQHLALNYRSDNFKYKCKFSKEFTATEEDMLIKIDGFSSRELI